MIAWKVVSIIEIISFYSVICFRPRTLCYNLGMSLLETLDRKYGRYVPNNITKILLIGQALSFVLTYIHPEYFSYLYLSGRQLFRGEIWRLVSFLFAPISQGLLFFLLALYFFYLFGTALENRWGSFRY